ncbi:MAG: hypothetical protein VXZ21_05270 [Bacteroidota bacterium]|nr:hypothetical protein [Bacteroidota bacterium]MEC9135241.1 hypothetical protein [Bacteroidota bacterium]
MRPSNFFFGYYFAYDQDNDFGYFHASLFKNGTYSGEMSKTENLFFFVFEEYSDPKMTEMAMEVITLRETSISDFQLV